MRDNGVLRDSLWPVNLKVTEGGTPIIAKNCPERTRHPTVRFDRPTITQGANARFTLRKTIRNSVLECQGKALRGPKIKSILIGHLPLRQRDGTSMHFQVDLYGPQLEEYCVNATSVPGRLIRPVSPRSSPSDAQLDSHQRP